MVDEIALGEQGEEGSPGRVPNCGKTFFSLADLLAKTPTDAFFVLISHGTMFVSALFSIPGAGIFRSNDN